MKSLALVNNKGGVGKTAFAVTLPAELERGVLTQVEVLDEITRLKAKTPTVR